jgi:hypothetical protein
VFYFVALGIFGFWFRFCFVVVLVASFVYFISLYFLVVLLARATCRVAFGTWHLARATCHVQRATWHLPPFTWHVARGGATLHVPRATCYVAPAAFHLARGTWRHMPRGHVPHGTCHVFSTRDASKQASEQASTGTTNFPISEASQRASTGTTPFFAHDHFIVVCLHMGVDINYLSFLL